MTDREDLYYIAGYIAAVSDVLAENKKYEAISENLDAQSNRLYAIADRMKTEKQEWTMTIPKNPDPPITAVYMAPAYPYNYAETTTTAYINNEEGTA